MGTAGYRETPEWLTTEWMLAALAKRKSKAMEMYCDFVAEGKNQPSPWESLRNQVFLRNKDYVLALQKNLMMEKT